MSHKATVEIFKVGVVSERLDGSRQSQIFAWVAAPPTVRDSSDETLGEAFRADADGAKAILKFSS